MNNTDMSRGWYLREMVSMTFVKPEIVDADTLSREELVEWVKHRCELLEEREEREEYC